MIRDWSPRGFFWIWSSFGPGLNGIEDGLLFVNGVHPHPIAGPDAERFQLLGYYTTPYVDGEEFSHWEGEGYRRKAIFKKQASSEITQKIKLTGDNRESEMSEPPAELPEKLSEKWTEFLGKYTAKGRLKREYRHNGR